MGEVSAIEFQAMIEDAEAHASLLGGMVEHPAFLAEVQSAMDLGWAKRKRSKVPSEFYEDRWRGAIGDEILSRQLAALRGAIEAGDAAAAIRAYGCCRSIPFGFGDCFGSGARHEDQQAMRGFADRDKRLGECGIRIAAKAHAPLMLDCLKPTDALSRVKDWVTKSEDGALLALVGGTGVGKTVAAAWALLQVGGEAVRSDELSFLSGSNYSADRDRFREIVTTRGLLVVDDVGTERDEAKARHGLFDLVDIRQGKGMRTLLTSNVTAEVLRSRLCERTLSRLRAVGGQYSCKGTDMREAA